MTDLEASPEALARSLVGRVLDLLYEWRSTPTLKTPRAPESASAQAERLLYLALVGALEAGLVRTMEDAVTVLRQASQPLGLMSDEWLKLQEWLLPGDRTVDMIGSSGDCHHGESRRRQHRQASARTWPRPPGGTSSRMKPIARARTTMVLLAGALVLAGCVSTPIPPTYTQEELKAKCERRGGWWHPDSLTGGFCEPIHS